MAILALLLAPPAGAEGGAAACMRVETALVAGQVPLREDLAPAACAEAKAPAGFRYDRAAGTVRALRDLPAGTLIPAVPTSLLAAVRPGETLVVTARVGSAPVTREVIARRAARAGEAMLVRGDRGETFTVRQAEARRP